MAQAQTFFTNEVTWEGMTWTFQNPVSWGYFINGQPFVLAQPGTGVTLVSVEPGPQFIPYQQIRGKTSASSATVRVVDAYGYDLSGSTTLNYGVMWNQPGNTHGTFINGQYLNVFPQVQSSPGTTSAIESNAEIGGDGPAFKPAVESQRWLVSADTRLQNFTNSSTLLTAPTNLVAQAMSTALNSWINSPRGLCAGDVLLSHDAPYYEDSEFANSGFQIPGVVSTSAINSISTRRLGVLTVVPSIPDENQFRPPVYWNPAYGSRPTGFILGDVSGKTAAFLSLPTKGLDGRTFGVFDPNQMYLAGSTMSLGLMSADSETRKCFKYPIPPMGGLIVGNTTLASSLSLNQNLYRLVGVGLLNHWGVLRYDQSPVNLFSVNSIAGAPNFNYMYNNMPIFTAMSAFADWHNPVDRRNSLIRTIQYAIDLYGMLKSNISVYRIGQNGLMNALKSDSVCQRGLIILAGWLLNNQEMMNVDSVNEQEGLTWFNWATNSPREFGLNFPTLTRMNSAILFAEGNVRRLAGTYGDPSVANRKALAYTNPESTADVGLGWALKFNTSPLDLSYGMTLSSAGLTYNPGILIAYNTTLTSGQTHATCLLPMYCGRKIPFQGTVTPGSTSGLIPFPKWNLVTTTIGTDSVYTASVNKTKLIGLKLRVVSGAGSGATEYTIVGLIEENAPNPIAQSPLYNGSVTVSNNTATWSGITRVGFILDKEWQNGTPDGTSRIIIYPFSASDIGKCFSPLVSIAQMSVKQTTGINPNPDRTALRGGTIAKTAFVSSSLTTSAAEPTLPSSTITYFAYLYGLLYQIGKRYPESGILNNSITQDVMDMLIEHMFGSEPYSPYRTLAGDTNALSLTSFATLQSNSVVPMESQRIGLRNYYGGLLRQLWEREVPRSRT